MAPGTLPADPASMDESPVEEAPPQIPDFGGDGYPDLPKQLVNVLKDAIEEFQGQDKFARRREIRASWRRRLYDAGMQFLQWVGNQSSSGFMQLQPGMVVRGAGGEIQCPAYMDAYPIFHPFFRIIQSVLTQSFPGVNPKPDDASNPADIESAKVAEKYEKLFDRNNDIKDLMEKAVRFFGMDGRTVAWTRTDDDCPDRPEIATMHGTLESRVPILCKKFDKKAPFCFLLDDLDITIAKAMYPHVADKLKAGQSAIGENNYERNARLGLLAGSNGQFQIGDSLSHIISGYPAAFLRPSAFRDKGYDDEPCEDMPGMTVAQAIESLWPAGVRAVFWGDTYCYSYDEDVDDHITIEFPIQGDGLSRAGFMEPICVDQDHFNDLVNWMREKIDTGAGATYANAEQVDVDALTSQRAAPNSIYGIKGIVDVPGGQPLGDSFFQSKDPEIPATLFKLMEFIGNEFPEFQLAALPSLQGGDAGEDSPASKYAQATANAKGQLGPMWTRLQRLFAGIREQAAWAAAADQNKIGVTKIPGKKAGEIIPIDMDLLRKGNFGYHMDEDSGFPESAAQKRSTLQNMMNMAGQSPELQMLLDNPSNIEQFLETNGYDGLVFIPAEARTKQLGEIEKLLATAPVPPAPDAIMGAKVMHAASSFSAKAQGQPEPPFAPPPDQPSVPIQELDYHQFEFATCQEWLSSKARREQDEQGNQAGVQNVILHALAHRAKMQEMIAQAAPPPVPGRGTASPPRHVQPTPGTVAPQTA